jgi:hypothetical protein
MDGCSGEDELSVSYDFCTYHLKATWIDAAYLSDREASTLLHTSFACELCFLSLAFFKKMKATLNALNHSVKLLDVSRCSTYHPSSTDRVPRGRSRNLLLDEYTHAHLG